MTMVIKKPKAQEKSTIGILCSFTDEEENPVTPKSITWTFTDKNGTVIHERADQPVSPPASEIHILLTGDDLEILEHERQFQEVSRKLLIHAVYDSSLGSDLPLNEELTFILENLAYPT